MAQRIELENHVPLTGERFTALPQWRWRVTVRTVTIGLVVGSVLAALSMGGIQLRRGQVKNAVGLALPDKTCESYPWLMYKEVLYNNLGNSGPDSGNGEGLVIRARDMGGGDPRRLGKNTLLVLNSTDDKYKAAAPPMNGLLGRFGTFNLPGNAELNFKLTFRDENGQPLTLKRFALTFFDLDSDVGHKLNEEIALSGFKEYFTTLQTEVQIEKQGELTDFKASTTGTGEDNPKNPMAMTQLQKNRAVAVIFENVTEIIGRAKTGAGTGGLRVFSFVSKNALSCARSVPEFPGMPLEDLNYHPPMEVPVEAPANSIFDQWLVNKGDRVSQGTTMAIVNEGGSPKEIKSPQNGTVMTQQPLIRGDVVGEKLITLNIAVIKADKLKPLATGPSTTKAAECLQDHRFFKEFHVKVGDMVRKGDPLVTTMLQDKSGEKELLAPRDGGVAELQKMSEGHPCGFVEDGNLVTLGKFAALSASIGESPVQLMDGAIFEKWLADVGDDLKVGDPIAQIKTLGGTCIKKTAQAGKVVDRQPILEGSELYKVLPNEDLLVVKPDGKLRPLESQGSEEPVTKGAGAEFVEWKKQVGDKVKKDDVIATMKDESGSETTAVASRDGIVSATVEGLKPGDKFEDVMESENLATIGDFLRPLKVGEMQQASHVPKDNMIFKKWEKLIGENVVPGDLIAVLEDPHMKMVNVTAEGAGIIVDQQDLKPNDVIDDLVGESPSMDGQPAQVLAVIDNYLRKLEAGPGESIRNWKHGMIFKEWNVELGDNVTKGDPIATVELEKIETTVPAPSSGLVTARQEGLTEGTVLTEDPGTIATIGKEFRPLKVLYAEEGHDVEHGDVFEKFLVDVGDKVEPGDPVAELTDKEGKEKTLKLAQLAGLVVSRQEPLQKGMKIDEVMSDRNIIVAGLKLRSLHVPHSSAAIDVSAGSVFKEWKKVTGDEVEKEDVIAKVQAKDGSVEDVLSTRKGVITNHEKALKEGMNIDDVMQDRTIAVVDEKLGQLGTKSGGEIVSAPPDSKFEAWLVNVSDIVKRGHPVATLKSEQDKVFNVTALRSGVIKKRQEGLRPGMEIAKDCEDASLVVIGKLPALESNDGMARVIANEGFFKEWKAEVGDEVEEGDPVAVVTHEDGEEEVLLAPKAGKVFSRQDHLVNGSDLSMSLEDGDILVVGRFVEMKPAWTAKGVDAPPEAVFKEWKVHMEDPVDTGDVICEVLIPKAKTPGATVESIEDAENGETDEKDAELGETDEEVADQNATDEEDDQGAGRRLRRLEADPEWETKEIKAPTWGKMTGEQPLKPGMTIGNQQVGPTVAEIDRGTPWWIWVLGILSVLCCCLCCLFYVMKKPVPEIVPEVEQPLKEADPVSGLIFDDGSRRHMIEPHYRPLGIKHDHVAPIIVKEFTVNSYAKKELDIQKTWKLVAINGEELDESTDFAWVSQKLGNYMKDFPLWPLPLEFQGTQNSVVSGEWKSRPIGIEFERRAPIRVSSVAAGSYAESLGVKRGMQLTKIGDEDVSDKKRPYKEVLDMFKEAVLALDTATGDEKAVAGRDNWFDRAGSQATMSFKS